MKKIVVGLVFLLQGLYSYAQGIVFETGTWTEVVEKAQKLNRPIFVDVYTSWCGPCRVMAATTFTQKEAGDVYNNSFVNVKIDAEKGEGIGLAKKYKVQSYPTYLFIDPMDETLVGVGKSSMPTTVFADLGRDMHAKFTNTEVTTAAMTSRYKSGNYDEDFLQRYIRRLKSDKADVAEPLALYQSKYMSQNPTDDQLFFLGANYMGGVKLYGYLLVNYDKIDAILCKKDGLSAANFDTQLMAETDRQMTSILNNRKLTKNEKEKELRKCFLNISTFVKSESNRDRKILTTIIQFYAAEKDTEALVHARREFITKLVLPDHLTSRINRTPFIVDKNKGEPQVAIDSAFAAQASVGYAMTLLKLSQQQEDKDLAMQIYQKAQRLTPATWYYSNIMNMTLYNLGDSKKATKGQSDLVKIMKKSQDPYLAAGEQLLEKMKRKETNLSFVSLQNKKKK